jgi:FkbM family methyltransferase
MLSTINSIIPSRTKKRLKNKWQIIRPPRIKLDQFIDEGCLFEITSKTERARIITYGEEAETLERFLSVITPNDVFFDVGSCLGLYAIHAALIGCRVYAFEPDPKYRKRLRKNIRINKLSRKIKILDWAVSNSPGYATLYTDGIDGNSPSLREVGTRGRVVVKTNSLDNAIIKRKLPIPNVIKIDIEGAEILALRGMDDVLSSCNAPKFLFIEFHPDFLQNFNSSISECLNLVGSYGYKEIYSKHRSNQIHYFFTK